MASITVYLLTMALTAHQPAASILLTLLALALIAAIATDLRDRIIPNRLNAGIALMALAWWLAAGLSGGQILTQLAMGAVVLSMFALAYALGMMGGGDVKLLAALALWLSLGQYLTLLAWMAIGGGVLTLVMVAQHSLRRLPGRPEIPYGVAIAGSALFVLANDILTAAAA